MKRLVSCGLLALLLSGSLLDVQASIPYETKTRGSGEERDTQTAYEPYEIIKVSANAPEDIFYDDEFDILYVADTQNARVLAIQGEQSDVIGEGILATPCGLYRKDGLLYVADSTKAKIFVFNQEGEVVQSFGKPKEALFGESTSFIPKKISVDNRGNMYVIVEGSSSGIVQLNKDGNFLGYVGSNQANISFDMMIKRMFFTSSQKDQLFANLPPSPTGIALDERGLLYSSTFGLEQDGIKKFNAAGTSMLAGKMQHSSATIVDIDIDAQENIFSVGSDGFISESDSYGNFLFSFGSLSTLQDVQGLLKAPQAIDVADTGTLYVLDKERSLIQLYRPTTFAKKVHEGVAFYKDGRYIEGEPVWNDVLSMNSSFMLSYQALAKSYYKQGDQDAALTAFQLADDKLGYSNAFWEIRNRFLQEKLGIGIGFLLCFFIAIKIIKYLDKKKSILDGMRKIVHRLNRISLLRELAFTKHFLSHPLDAFYEMRFRNRISILTASILYGCFIGIYVLGFYLRGYLFQDIKLEDINLLIEVGKVGIPFALFIVSNYLVTSIQDGEGRLKDVYIGSICAFIPYLYFALPLYAVSNILSLNEAFIYDFGSLIIYGYSILLIFIMVKEVHNYSFGKTIKIMLVTLFTAAMLVLLGVVLFVLAQHALNFVESTVQELKSRG